MHSSCCLRFTWTKKRSEHPQQSGIQGTPMSVFKPPAVRVVSNVGPLDWAADFSCDDHEEVLPARTFITNYCHARD